MLPSRFLTGRRSDWHLFFWPAAVSPVSALGTAAAAALLSNKGGTTHNKYIHTPPSGSLNHQSLPFSLLLSWAISLLCLSPLFLLSSSCPRFFFLFFPPLPFFCFLCVSVTEFGVIGFFLFLLLPCFIGSSFLCLNKVLPSLGTALLKRRSTTFYPPATRPNSTAHFLNRQTHRQIESNRIERAPSTIGNLDSGILSVDYSNALLSFLGNDSRLLEEEEASLPPQP